MQNINWLYRRFDELTVNQLYENLRLRQSIFMMEQKILYLDLDGYDKKAMHLMGWRGDKLVAYLRVLPQGMKYKEHAITRVVVDASERGNGTGLALMREAMRLIGNNPIRLSGQVHLAESFYGKLGFRRDSDVYDDEGSPHVQMLFTP